LTPKAKDLNTVAERVTRENETAQQLPNHQLVVVAAYLVGAHSSAADTEDIAVKTRLLSFVKQSMIFQNHLQRHGRRMVRNKLRLE
jgi:hypothetical protein